MGLSFCKFFCFAPFFYFFTLFLSVFEGGRSSFFCFFIMRTNSLPMQLVWSKFVGKGGGSARLGGTIRPGFVAGCSFQGVLSTLNAIRACDISISIGSFLHCR